MNLNKALKVVSSCETLEQLEVAANYIELYYQMYNLDSVQETGVRLRMVWKEHELIRPPAELDPGVEDHW